MYKYEMHLHTSRTSACAISDAKEMVAAAKENGYAGIVLTNHFFHGNTAVDRSLPWEEFFNAYVDDYVEAVKYGKEIDMDVFFGIEEGIGGGKEVLIYGVPAKAYLECSDFLTKDIYGISKFVHDNGGYIAMAHPFRHRNYIANPDAEPDLTPFDAIEVFNQCNTKEDNEHARQFAEKNDFPVIAGSDIHLASKYADKTFGGSGIAFEKRLYTEKEFIKQLKNGNYKLIKNGKIV